MPFSRLRSDVDLVKALLGIIFGGILAGLTVWLNHLISHPYSDVVLLAIYSVNYLPASWVANVVSKTNTFRKGASVFYAFQFISWVATYETLYPVII